MVNLGYTILGVFLGFVLGLIVGGLITQKGIRTEAVKVGVAKYTVNDIGEVKFEWIKE